MSDRTAYFPQLASLTSATAALGTTERKAKDILCEAGIPTIELGARTRGVRVSDLRSVLKRRERAA